MLTYPLDGAGVAPLRVLVVRFFVEEQKVVQVQLVDLTLRVAVLVHQNRHKDKHIIVLILFIGLLFLLFAGNVLRNVELLEINHLKLDESSVVEVSSLGVTLVCNKPAN